MKLMMGAFYYRVIFHVLLSKSHVELSACKEDPFLKPPVPPYHLLSASLLMRLLLAANFRTSSQVVSLLHLPSVLFPYFLPLTSSSPFLPPSYFDLLFPLPSLSSLFLSSPSPLLFLLCAPLPWLPPIYLMSVSRYLFYYYYLGTISKNPNFSSFSKNHHQQKPS